jgi:CMP-N-acetylneuraminic acid synthetase
MVSEKIIAIIPARGGSKRIPQKNIVDFGGKPMIAWTIEAALKSKFVSRVIVSTDDEQIAEISKFYGAEVPFLRDQNADDHSSVSLATIRTLLQLEDLEKNSADIVVQLMANCPLRNTSDINLAIENFVSKKLRFQISSFKYGWMNPWWAHEINIDGIAQAIFPDEIRLRRSQDQPELYCPIGAIWISIVSDLLDSKTFYGKNYSFFPMPWENAIDIDDYNDLKMAEFLLKKNAE